MSVLNQILSCDSQTFVLLSPAVNNMKFKKIFFEKKHYYPFLSVLMHIWVCCFLAIIVFVLNDYLRLFCLCCKQSKQVGHLSVSCLYFVIVHKYDCTVHRLLSYPSRFQLEYVTYICKIWEADKYIDQGDLKPLGGEKRRNVAIPI